MAVGVKNYNNPPIIEALLDIRCDLPEGAQYTLFESGLERLGNPYSVRKDRYQWESGVEFRLTEVPVHQVSGGQIGYQFETADGGSIVQMRTDGFTVNKLKPYSGWDALQMVAQQAWGTYLELGKPINITRLAIRYINRIEIPLPFEDFKQYILTVPEIAAGSPQAMSGMFMQLTVPDPENSNVAIITETFGERMANQTFLPFIFDIDVIRDEAVQPTDTSLWDRFGSIRETRNKIFFNSITSATEELFK